MGFKEKVAVLNPSGIPKPWTRIPLAPRLSDLEGKTIYVIPVFYHDDLDATGAPRAIVANLLEVIPGVKAVYPKTAYSRGPALGDKSNLPTEEEWDDLKNADAIVNAVSW